MPLVRGPSDPDLFRVSVNGARWYRDYLPAGNGWGQMTEPVPAVTTIKKAWNKPFRKRTPTGLVVPLDAYRAAQYVSDNLSQLADMHPDQVFTLVATAPESDLARAAQRGTGVHSVIEAMAMGQVVSPDLQDDDVRPFLPACERFVEEWAPQWRMTEFIVIERRLGFAGTADALVEFPGVDCPICGEPFGLTLVDWKSRGSAHGAYPEEVCQLGGYSLGEYVIVADEQGQPVRQDPPKVDHGAIVSLTADDGYRLYPVEIEQARQAFLGLFETWRISRDGQSVARKAVGNPALPPYRPSGLESSAPPEPADTAQAPQAQTNDESESEAHEEKEHSELDDLHWLRSRVVAIVETGRPLPSRWPAGVPTFKSGESLSSDHLAEIERWCDDTEAMFGLPFPPERPSDALDVPEDPEPEPAASRGPTARDEAEEWGAKGRALLSVLDDEQLARACAAVAQCDDVIMTRVRYLALAAIVTQVSDPAGILVARWSGSGVSLTPHEDIHLALLAQMPTDGVVITKATRSVALQRARRVAKKLGVPSPKSYEDLTADLLLAACVAVGHGVEPAAE